MKLRNFLLLLFILGVIGGAGALFYFYKTIPNVAQSEQQLNQAVLSVQASDARVNEAVLRSRESGNVSYDYLNAQSQALEAAVSNLANLEQQFRQFGIEHTGVQAKTNALSELVQKKLNEAERFKSHNAVLKNSSKYAPIVGGQLIELAKKEGDTELALLYGKAVRDLESFILTNDSNFSDSLKKTMQQLVKQEQSLSKIAFAEQLEFANHVTVALQETADTNRRVTDVINTQTQTGINRLNDVWKTVFDQQRQKAEQFTLFSAVYIAFLLLGLLVILWWLRNVYRNQDQLVLQRTRALQVAYDKLKVSQLRLVQSEKMALLGQMIAGIAHEVNTPLGYVKSNVELTADNIEDYNDLLGSAVLLSTYLRDANADEAKIEATITALSNQAKDLQDNEVPAENKQLIEDSLFGLEQIGELVNDLKNFARLDESKVQKVNLKSCIETSLNIAKNNIKSLKLLKPYKTVELPEIQCSPSQINQVLLNLLNNAAHAVDKADGTIAVNAGITPDGQFVFVQVADNGSGMDKATMKKIFDPFFTTKGAGKGTGLGLAISHQIIEQHGGVIQVSSKIGRGTVFRIKLPTQQEGTDVAEEEVEFLDEVSAEKNANHSKDVGVADDTIDFLNKTA